MIRRYRNEVTAPNAGIALWFQSAQAWPGVVSSFVRQRCHMGNQNRKATRDEMAHARRVIREAFPELEPVFGGHGDYGGHRAPRDHTLSFRLKDKQGNLRSNVVWVMPEDLWNLTVQDVESMVNRANGRRA